MPFTPNLAPNYAIGPIAAGPIALPSTAKTALNDQTNAVQILASTANNRQVITGLSVEVTATLTAGKLLAFLSNGTSVGQSFEVGSVAHAALTVSTTAAVTPIAFAFTPTAPLIIPEGYSLWLASAVAQPAGALIGYGIGKIF